MSCYNLIITTHLSAGRASCIYWKWKCMEWRCLVC